MKSKTIWIFLFVLAVATGAEGQNKLSAPWQCTKPEPQYRIDVADRPNHAFVISQFKCTAMKPWEIAGVQTEGGTGTHFDDVRGTTSRYRGYFVATMANGDKAFYPYQGTATLKEGVIESAEHKWTLVGGTGKLKGVKGQGTCKGKGNPDGTVNWECEGEYQPAQ